MPVRFQIRIAGAVQGVGFRPFVYSLAARLGLYGHVANDPAGVITEIEGEQEATERFLDALRSSPPPMARVASITFREIPPTGETGFSVRLSAQHGARTTLILPDMATCGDCLREMSAPDDRRYRYAFINCTNCGPRYTIIRDLPYDRSRTTMSPFEMCPDCRREYEDPANRRFHAEPTCCPACGPRLRLLSSDGTEIACDDPLEETIRRIRAGRIAAVKGLGGFHLACDAANQEAVALLRRRKHRDHKPFAIMVRDVRAAARICRIGPEEEALLSSPERPIVLIEKREGNGLAEGVAPRSASFGVMLPYTPLHHMLMAEDFTALIMTSGNFSDEPIAHSNEDARVRLSGLADCFLLHDRSIHIRTDDSVVQVIAQRSRFLRRSRGYAPAPVKLPCDISGGEILAVGPELNNTICVTRSGNAFLSHHVGDLQNVPAYESFIQAVRHMEDILAVKPSVVARDMHPGYLSTRYAMERGLPIEPVQHHHAHIASVMAEAGRTDRVIGVSFDGMGWGRDGGLWGGEFMLCDLADFERFGSLEAVPQPGGDVASKDTRRMAYAFLRAAFGRDADALACEMLPGFAGEELRIISRMIEKRVNCPLTSSMGRLFDAVAALLGICGFNSFHAQAPMELEAKAREAKGEDGFYEAGRARLLDGMIEVRTSDIVRGLVSDARGGAGVAVCAARFHNSIARLALDMCLEARKNTCVETVALSGGVMANACLLERLLAMLEKDGFEVLLNADVPPGDGGVSFGQAAVAAWRRRCALQCRLE
ncbi:MAG TPA: carbamoyltransferase HypF [Candidatus Brocadiia bacterium]|nr:carbamoyltransferase HypF [Candidatus Brocadiia bacterium]